METFDSLKTRITSSRNSLRTTWGGCTSFRRWHTSRQIGCHLSVQQTRDRAAALASPGCWFLLLASIVLPTRVRDVSMWWTAQRAQQLTQLVLEQLQLASTGSG